MHRFWVTIRRHGNDDLISADIPASRIGMNSGKPTMWRVLGVGRVVSIAISGNTRITDSTTSPRTRSR